MHYQESYRVSVTKIARRQGDKLGITNVAKFRVINHLKLLKFWPDISSEFDHELAFGAIEFKFYEEKHWIRVFVYKDDVRKIMWVIKVLSKKTNKLMTADKISIETAVARIEHDIKNHNDNLKKQASNLKIIEGGKNE